MTIFFPFSLETVNIVIFHLMSENIYSRIKSTEENLIYIFFFLLKRLKNECERKKFAQNILVIKNRAERRKTKQEKKKYEK